MNPAASSKRPRKREEREPSLVNMDEGQGSCFKLGATAKSPPAYGDRHGMKEDAVNWGDPPLHEEVFFFRKRMLYKPKGEVSYSQEGSPRGS